MDLKNNVKRLRNYRKYHRWIGVVLAFFLLISALTGILLAWKKDVSVIQPPTQKGAAQTLAAWKSLEELEQIALNAFEEANPDLRVKVDRMDVRPSKGIVKVLLDHGWWEVQVDGSTGAVLSVARRHSDWIEAIHDGSIVGDFFKLISMNTLGIGLVIMIFSGVWLWYGPRQIRWAKKRKG